MSSCDEQFMTGQSGGLSTSSVPRASESRTTRDMESFIPSPSADGEGRTNQFIRSRGQAQSRASKPPARSRPPPR